MIIDQLPLINDVQGTDEFPVERGTTTYKGTITQILANVPPPPSPAADTPIMDGTGAVGTSAKYAREDHVHPSDTSKQTAITATGMLKGTGSAVSSATKGTDYAALSFQITLASANWSSNEQTVSNANFLASGYAYVITPNGSDVSAYGTAQIYADDIDTDGQITFHCTTAPSSDLTVNVMRVVSA